MHIQFFLRSEIEQNVFVAIYHYLKILILGISNGYGMSSELLNQLLWYHIVKMSLNLINVIIKRLFFRNFNILLLGIVHLGVNKFSSQFLGSVPVLITSFIMPSNNFVIYLLSI